MYDLYERDEIKEVLFMDVENALKQIIREAVYNISITCLIILTFISDCYFVPTKLFIKINKEPKCQEGITQRGESVIVLHAC